MREESEDKSQVLSSRRYGGPESKGGQWASGQCLAVTGREIDPEMAPTICLQRLILAFLPHTRQPDRYPPAYSDTVPSFCGVRHWHHGDRAIKVI